MRRNTYILEIINNNILPWLTPREQEQRKYSETSYCDSAIWTIETRTSEMI